MINDSEIAENAVLIVTGSNLRAEQADRPLAYQMQNQISQWADAQEMPLKALVISDLWYLNASALHQRPTISIGGPGVNALSAHFSRRLANLLVVESTLVIQMDPAFLDLRASLWGADHEATVNAIEIFTAKGYLQQFLQAAMAKTID